MTCGLSLLSPPQKNDYILTNKNIIIFNCENQRNILVNLLLGRKRYQHGNDSERF